MPRKRSEPSHLAASRGDGLQDAGAPLAGIRWPAVVVAVLVTARFFLPAESAAQGETLWIVFLWLLCGVTWLALAIRQERGWRRLDWLDVGLSLLVGGHIVSALLVLITDGGGDKRASLNMLWEWVGMGAAALMLRTVMQIWDGRDLLLKAIVISGVVLAGLGLWQHFVWYPRISAQFAALENLRSTLPTDDPAAASGRLQRITDLQRELGITPGLDEGSLSRFRNRVQASTEPIGRFALANTFAGLLLATFLLSAGATWCAARQGTRTLRWAGLLAGVLVVGYCLWLTKSRSALVGLVCGLAVGGVLARRQVSGSRQLRWAVAGAAVVLIGMPLLAFLSGSLDRQVFSEAPKSVRYRLEYWTATGQVIADHPLLGVGPGNFRQHYLRHKLPGSSEEILDPHNLFLDVWANGGLIALAGLLILLGVTGWRCRSAPDETPAHASDSIRPARFAQILLLGGIGTAALLLAALCELLRGTGIGAEWLALGAAWWAATFLFTLGPPLLFGRTLVVAAFVSLVVHLIGAGGIAMPAILQVLLILLFAVADVQPAIDSMTPQERQWVPYAALVAGLALVVACVTTALIPVTTATAAINLGRVLWQIDGSLSSAERQFLQATEDDPLSPEPWLELARLRSARWMQSRDDTVFDQAIAAQQEAISRDPVNAGLWRGLGELWSQRHAKRPDPEFAEHAYAALTEAVQRYPHLSAAQAELAVAAQQAGREAEAAAAARMAMHLDDLNRQGGHVDTFLPDSQLSELRRLVIQ